MAYRNPRYYFHHALRSAGVAAIGGSTFDAIKARVYVHDSGLSLNGAFDVAAVNQFVKADRGVGFASLVSPDRLIIPSGHTISTNTLELRHHTSDPPNGTTGTLIYGPTAQAAGQRVLTLSPVLSQRYLSVTVPASGEWEFPELWITQQRTTVKGLGLDWRDAEVANQFENRLEGGQTYRLELGEDKRRFEWVYNGLSGADLQVFKDMRTETRNGLYPMYVDPPDDTESPILMQAIEGIEFEQDFQSPASSIGPQFRLKLTLLEVLS
jgi:hypothetical protein